MNFQRAAVEQGEHFAQTCLMALRYAGFEVATTKERTADMRIELDAIANNRHGIAFPFEFKGSYQGNRPGMMRSDTVKKAITTAYLFSLDEMAATMTPLVILTSNKPVDTTAAAQWLRRVSRSIILDVLNINEDRAALASYANATEAEIKRLIENNAAVIERLKQRNGYYDCYRQGKIGLPT